MSEYAALARRIEDREVILLDGAVGTQLQKMGVPLSDRAWAGIALKDYTYTVRRMHEDYIRAGVDIITTNTYPSARHNLEPIGLADMTTELNLRGVMLAQEARDRCAKDRPVYIAGSVSNFGLLAGAEEGWQDLYYFKNHAELTDRQAINNLREQAGILAEGGVDFLLAEATGSSEQRRWVIEACLSTGLPVWMGFKTRREEGEDLVKVGYTSAESFETGFEDLASLGGTVVNVFHSTIDATNATLPLVQSKWSGPIGIYPEADRHDYVDTHRNTSEETKVTPEEFAVQATEWVSQGVQIIGGCCGIELEFIEPLRDALPSHLPAA